KHDISAHQLPCCSRLRIFENSSALFTLVLREASESEEAPEGLLALAGHPRLAPAIAAMLSDPAQPWKMPDLADLCGMSRATFMRH
ncbi:hypothetical protein ACC772_38780, partial [Rhizobium ruizarguesonis]